MASAFAISNVDHAYRPVFVRGNIFPIFNTGFSGYVFCQCFGVCVRFLSPLSRRFLLKRFDTLDGLRGVAAILVLFRHSHYIGAELDAPRTYLAVDLFFVLSGFVIAHAYGRQIEAGMSFRDFMTRRLIRLYPLYALGTLVGLGGFVIGLALGVDSGPLALIAGLSFLLLPAPFTPGGPYALLFPLNGVGWSLFVEIAGNAVYHILARLLTTWVLIALVVILAVPMTLTIIHGGPFSALDGGFNIGNWPVGILRFAFSFSLGLLIYRLYDRLSFLRPFLKHPIVPFALLATLVMILTLPYFGGKAAPLYLAASVFFFVPSLVILGALCEPPPVFEPMFVALGSASYAIYITHYPVLQLSSVLARHFGIDLKPFNPALGLSFAAAWFTVGLLLARYYDQPLRAWLTKRFTPRNERR